ncbi:MAG: aspartate ammonia-lyase [Myxococcota bacterium]
MTAGGERPGAGEQRVERDELGERRLPAGAPYGIHTARAKESFFIAGRAVHPELVRAYGLVKLAAARTNRGLGCWREEKAAAIEAACTEMAEGSLTDRVVVDALQGGAGTSLNMNVNEVLANRALEILGHEPGSYDHVSPLGDLNRHQSTNDTFPTALRVAAILGIRGLEKEVLGLQEAFQAKERELDSVVKVGRTQLQDAVLVTLGREMSAYAEALGRDRWRLYKCEERLRVVNLGGTAVGTGLGAPREYIFRATDILRELTGIGLARAENLIEATQNNDVFVEVSGLMHTCAGSLVKISSDLRLLSAGPSAGLGEIELPARQAGSSIMPGKVNPVIPEAVTQAGLLVGGHHQVIAQAVSLGSLELNPFLPLVAHCLLESVDLLTRACHALRRFCVEGIRANVERCRAHVDGATATVTALIPRLGYEEAARVAARARREGRSPREVAVSMGLTPQEIDELTGPLAVCRLGSPPAAASRRDRGEEE